MESSTFEILSQSGHARRGRLSLAHGIVETPAFMPVGTYGAVKTIEAREVRELGGDILLSNAYHLSLRPGLELLERVGGLHRLMGWDGPILTDSGGFQVFSLGRLKEVTEEGVRFQSHLNGDSLFLSPERCARIQQVIGSDIAMVLDECIALPSDETRMREAMELSARWARRFLSVERKPGQLVFGIVQGGTSAALRRESLERTAELRPDGMAIGGLSVGEPQEVMLEVLDGLAPHLPVPQPHYLMGVGTPLDILESVRRGVDLFDCVLPTRNARNGGFFTAEGLLNIRNNIHALSETPIEPECACPCCRHYSRAYLRHLFQTKEILGCRLATLHNLYYYLRLMQQIRAALSSGTFDDFYARMRSRLVPAYAKAELLKEDMNS